MVTRRHASDATKPEPKKDLKSLLTKRNEIQVSVIGRKSGRWLPRPVWFVLEGDTLYLVPVAGSGTEWYKNVLANPTIRISAAGVQEELPVTPISDHDEVASVVEKFREKYGAGDVEKYYSKFDVAAVVDLSKLAARE